MTVSNIPILVDIKRKGTNMKCEIKNLAWWSNVIYEFPESILNMQGEMAWYNRIAYILAGLITNHYRINSDYDNNIMTALYLYSPYRAKFKDYAAAYAERYANIVCNSVEDTERYNQMVLKDTEDLSKVLVPLVIRLLKDEEMWKKAKKKVYIQYARTGSGTWHNARVNKRSVTDSKHPMYYPYYRALELYRKLGRWYRYKGTWEFRMIGEHGEAIPEQSELEEASKAMWEERDQRR